MTIADSSATLHASKCRRVDPIDAAPVTGQSSFETSRGVSSHEVDVVSLDALHRVARRFPREAPLGVGRHPLFAVRPARAHHMYNDFMDELEFAAECGFDAVCVNEHHSN